VISELVEQCGVSDIKEDKMFSTLRSMGDTIAVCDKLLRYPLPLAWSRHTSRWVLEHIGVLSIKG
jgi:predicted membrane chloride channel (bestrophin family)